MDQTPLAYDFLSKQTYNSKGSKTIWIKESKSGWNKRKATLQIAACTDGVLRCKPLLIFQGAEVGDVRRGKEKRRYSKEVEVCFNPKAWANENTMLSWLKHEYRMSSAYGHIGIEQEPRLLCLDAFAAYLTPRVRAAARAQRTTLSVILGGCTGYVQPLDVSLNKPIKALIKEEHDDHYDRHIEEWEAEKFNVGER
jgi:hypothetical protein